MALLMLIEACELKGISIKSANTDGILAELKTGQDTLFQKICADWEKQTKLKLEYNSYQRFVRRDVNNYTALTTDGHIKNKGVFTPPDIKHDVQAPIIQKVARLCLLYDEDPGIQLTASVQESDIYDFLFSFSGTKAFQIYLAEDDTYISLPPEWKISKSNRWYISNTNENQLIKQGGKNNSKIKIPHGENIQLMNDIDNTDIPDDINLDYYLKQIKKLINSCREK
jgi:hypothetical protein